VALAAEGAAVVVTGRSSGTGQGTFTEAVREIERNGGRALGVPCDLRDADQVTGLVQTAASAFGRLDVLVNNAGIYGPAIPTSRLTTERWDDVFATNLRAVFIACRAAIPFLRVRGGSIINVTSLAAENGFPAGLVDVAYSASKLGVNRLTAELANELQPDDIAVNALSPVRVRTEGVLTGWPGSTFPDYAEPRAIGPVVTFLACQRSSFTGRVVRRDEFVEGEYRPGSADPVEALFPVE
jgi:NAD(P)-dependent dehydrogenase (short-subunit alcohol dehydrogenase family)